MTSPAYRQMTPTLFVLVSLVMTCNVRAQRQSIDTSSLLHDLIRESSKAVQAGEGFTFTEGPTADADGNVLFTDIPQERIYMWRANTGDIELWKEKTDRINGLIIRSDGIIVGCQMGQGRQLVSIDPRTKVITSLIGSIDGKKFNAPNDVTLDQDDGMWFTDPAYGRKPDERELDEEAVYWLSPDARTVRKVADGLQRPNGIAFSPDYKTLYVADRDADTTFAYPVLGPGRLGKRVVFAETGSDGFAVDALGNLYVTPKDTAIYIFTPSGKKIGEIPLPIQPSNLTFGGADRRTLFITARDRVFTVPMNIQGSQ